ncbi:PREDICTED: uncharacterized protein PF11_0213-like [Cyphomyrmex costatus]|uniref:uncharacterized protein PF11_0213-like n=1 Tax=Cyphomyrmex costatus TaxID=456900 RepID=UPI0008521EC5|nr:PREDICTED: uncharacterized protein PF11_0213-like [Cyphomyrmex costatus]
MNGIIKWPPKSMEAGLLVRKEKDSENYWKEYPIHIKGYYDAYLKACQVCNEYIKDSNYESEIELGRGFRKKRKVTRLDSDSDSKSNDESDKKKKKHKLEDKIRSPPEILLSDSNVLLTCKNSQNYPKYSISKQRPKKTQVNIVSHEKDLSYNCEQNKISDSASNSNASDKNSELLGKLEQARNFKKQIFHKKTILDRKNHSSSHNIDRKNQKEDSESDNEQNRSVLQDVPSNSDSYEDIQEEKRNCEDLSYDCESTCEQNKISDSASNSNASDKNFKLIGKLEQVRNVKKQIFHKKTILDRKNHFLHNIDRKNQKEDSESENEQNRSVLQDVSSNSDSYEDIQEEKKNCEDLSYDSEFTCEQNKISIETVSDSGLSDKNFELIRKLEEVKNLKKQTPDKKITSLDKKNHSSHNIDEKSQREYSKRNNELNRSVIQDVPSHSRSYQDLQRNKKRKVYDLTQQSKKKFPKESSSTTTNKSISYNSTSYITPVEKEIIIQNSSSSLNTMLRSDSLDTTFSKSSSYLQSYDLVQKEDSHCRSPIYKSTNTEYSLSREHSISDNSAQSICKELTLLQTIIMECKKEIRKVSSKLDISLMNQENLCRIIIPGGKVIKRPSAMPPLPINTLEDLNKMEKFLANDYNLTGACSYLGKNIDKASVGNSVRKILAKLVTNTLATKYSMQGHGNKKRFDALKLWDLVQGALLTQFEISDISVAEKSAAMWLTNSSWRKQEDGSFGKRTSKEKKKKST